MYPWYDIIRSTAITDRLELAHKYRLSSKMLKGVIDEMKPEFDMMDDVDRCLEMSLKASVEGSFRGFNMFPTGFNKSFYISHLDYSATNQTSIEEVPNYWDILKYDMRDIHRLSNLVKWCDFGLRYSSYNIGVGIYSSNRGDGASIEFAIDLKIKGIYQNVFKLEMEYDHWEQTVDGCKNRCARIARILFFSYANKKILWEDELDFISIIPESGLGVPRICCSDSNYDKYRHCGISKLFIEKIII